VLPRSAGALLPGREDPGPSCGVARVSKATVKNALEKVGLFANQAHRDGLVQWRSWRWRFAQASTAASVSPIWSASTVRAAAQFGAGCCGHRVTFGQLVSLTQGALKTSYLPS